MITEIDNQVDAQADQLKVLRAALVRTEERLARLEASVSSAAPAPTLQPDAKAEDAGSGKKADKKDDKSKAKDDKKAKDKKDDKRSASKKDDKKSKSKSDGKKKSKKK